LTVIENEGPGVVGFGPTTALVFDDEICDVLSTKVAVTVLLAVTRVSVRAAVVTPSLQLTNEYPVAGTAVTGEPDAL
jgi:hypothetical protein